MIRKKCTKDIELSAELTLGNLIKGTRKSFFLFFLDLKTSQIYW